jgi:hypothetical protein
VGKATNWVGKEAENTGKIFLSNDRVASSAVC